ncbi:MAG: hypothetical protein LBF76_00990 [Holosporales bacterium]|nr:hypothetical protein [Holosporales bacterium]
MRGFFFILGLLLAIYPSHSQGMGDKSLQQGSGNRPRMRQSYSLFTSEEDDRLRQLMQDPACTKKGWVYIAVCMPGRNARQCRERWIHYLNPSVNRTPWTEGEYQLLIEKYNELGSAWTAIAQFFQGRSPNDIKNKWHLLAKGGKRRNRSKNKASLAKTPDTLPPKGDFPSQENFNRLFEEFDNYW